MLTLQLRNILHETAYASIESGLTTQSALAVKVSDYENPLQEKAATFVTLNKNNTLRGCIGILTPVRALIEDIAHNAYAAAFNDPRFKALTQNELKAISIHISILNKSEKMSFDSETDLINQLNPGVDGIIIEDGNHRSTFYHRFGHP